jgi:cytochrome P450
MSDTQLRDAVMTLLLAGHETTANALSWPGVAAQAGGGARDGAGRGRPRADPRGPAGLAYPRMVLDESMRLSPPAWIFSR